MKTSSSWDPAIPFKVGDWTVDPDSGRLQQGADEVKLEPKAMKVLVYLAQHPGKVVAREELAKPWETIPATPNTLRQFPRKATG